MTDFKKLAHTSGWLELLVAASAIPAGVGLMIAPDGSAIGLPPSLIYDTPFPNFFVPGLLLALFVGGSSLVAAYLVWRAHRRSPIASLAAGGILFGWIVTQLGLIGYVSVLQPLYALIAVAIIALTMMSFRREQDSHWRTS